VHRPPKDPNRAPAPRRLLALLSTALLTASLALTGCSSDGAGSSSSDAARGVSDDRAAGAPEQAPEGAGEGYREKPGQAAGTGEGGTQAKLPTARVVRTARLTVRVKDVPAALERARATAEDAGGYVGDETTDREPGGHERSRVVLRVPEDTYGTVLERLAGTGRLVERKVRAEDVTDQVVDVESRIASQEASVARVRKLMDRATSLSDVVTLENELSNRQAELEALKARQKSLRDRTSMATITLVLSETGAKPEKKEEETGFLDALAGGWNAFVTTLHWIAVALGAALPFGAALALIAVVVRTVRRRLPQPPAPPAPTTGGWPVANPYPAAAVPAPAGPHRETPEAAEGAGPEEPGKPGNPGIRQAEDRD
jgi:hypothetical protein